MQLLLLIQHKIVSGNRDIQYDLGEMYQKWTQSGRIGQKKIL